MIYVDWIFLMSIIFKTYKCFSYKAKEDSEREICAIIESTLILIIHNSLTDCISK